MPALAAQLKVWDRSVRLLHWALVFALLVAWTSTLGLGFATLHEPAGYAALGIVALRIIWGFCGSRYARFSQFVRGRRQVLRYANTVLEGHEQRYIGHNPLGGWMVLLLLVVVGLLGVTGWLYTTDYFWGMAWLDTLHTGLAWLLLLLVVLHLSGVALASWRHRENLVFALFSGKKLAPNPDDVDR